ncbi:MAG: DUF5671 domain-containing protein [Propionibacteriaceae bacterium]|nr:DUF5671 domain-containing protein [Propionibacteriaceae bacterium]
MSIFFALILWAIPVGLVILVVLLIVRRGQAAHDDPVSGTRGVRRFFQYLLLYALVIVSGIGVADLLGRLFGAENYEGYDLALPLAFTIVGVPLALAIAGWTRRMIRRDPREGTSLAHSIYVTLASLTSLIVAVVGLQGVLSALLGGTFDGGALANLVVWGGLWFLHWRLSRSLGEDRGWPHLLFGSLVGLSTAMIGFGFLLGASLSALFLDPPQVMIVGVGHDLAEYGALFAAGALVWVRYWATAAARLPRLTGWLVYVLPVGVGGGLLTALVAASLVLWTILVWVFGQPSDPRFDLHFSETPDALGFALVGLLVWWYHGAVLAEKRQNRTEVRRVYEYLVSAIGLLAAAAGVGMVIVAVIESFTPGLDLGVSVTNTILGAVTLLVVGLPLWWLFWSRIQQARTAEPESEITSPTRRTYLVLLFGIAGVAAVVALLVAVFILLQDITAGTASTETIRSMRYALGVLATTAAVSAYHGAVFREDRGVPVTKRPPAPRSVLLVGAAAPGLARTLARASGAHVELLVRADDAAPAWSEQALLAAFSHHPGEDILVMGGDALEVTVLDRGGHRPTA